MSSGQPAGAVTSWKSLVQGDGYLDARQRQAFEQAIGLVSRCLHTTLDKPAPRSSERFSLRRYVDGLEGDFRRDAGADPLMGDAALTASWIVQLLAEQLQEAAGSRTDW
ncbi:HrpW-specific chaperone [Pseudomonas vanderleydeniana]|uniref:HrpW-specific chaperone n=1 Tax=Pseudomonas vanderleydeniana TaxID=2745495 RepID=A0A9E6TV50_9PSED|nr:HrpW-specific chaperone [Pseudomonas vanderleydeniana]QXI31256.1 HrpW-specific chaperone [Pseudomonas vanderleydeniana]